jgi:hypothetical protein
VALLCFKDSFVPTKGPKHVHVSIIAEQPHPRKGQTSKDGDPDDLYLQYYLPMNLVLVHPATHRTPSYFSSFFRFTVLNLPHFNETGERQVNPDTPIIY